MLKDLMLEGIIIIINEKNFYNQPIYSDIKRYQEIRKLAMG